MPDIPYRRPAHEAAPSAAAAPGGTGRWSSLTGERPRRPGPARPELPPGPWDRPTLRAGTAHRAAPGGDRAVPAGPGTPGTGNLGGCGKCYACGSCSPRAPAAPARRCPCHTGARGTFPSVHPRCCQPRRGPARAVAGIWRHIPSFAVRGGGSGGSYSSCGSCPRTSARVVAPECRGRITLCPAVADPKPTRSLSLPGLFVPHGSSQGRLLVRESVLGLGVTRGAGGL